jgi:plasmid stabilization system protein ParE
LDLDQVWESIAQDNINAADGWVEKLFAAFDALARNPGIGHARQDLTSETVRFWPVGAYLTVYRAETRPIQIVAVVQGSRDIPSLLWRRAPQ